MAPLNFAIGGGDGGFGAGEEVCQHCLAPGAGGKVGAAVAAVFQAIFITGLAAALALGYSNRRILDTPLPLGRSGACREVEGYSNRRIRSTLPLLCAGICGGKWGGGLLHTLSCREMGAVLGCAVQISHLRMIRQPRRGGKMRDRHAGRISRYPPDASDEIRFCRVGIAGRRASRHKQPSVLV